MIVALSLLKWSESTPRTEIDRVLAEYQKLASLDGVLELTVGKNMAPWSAGYTDVIYVRLADQESFDRYRENSERQAISAQVDALEEHGIGVWLTTVGG